MNADGGQLILFSRCQIKWKEKPFLTWFHLDDLDGCQLSILLVTRLNTHTQTFEHLTLLLSVKWCQYLVLCGMFELYLAFCWFVYRITSNYKTQFAISPLIQIFMYWARSTISRIDFVKTGLTRRHLPPPPTKSYIHFVGKSSHSHGGWHFAAGGGGVCALSASEFDSEMARWKARAVWSQWRMTKS